MGIGKTLSEILKEKGSNANDLAERVGVSPSTIYSITKRDNMKVDITLLARICKVLNVEMQRFYDDYFAENPLPPSALLPATDKIDGLFLKLNDVGQEKVIAYAEDLLFNPAYRKESVVYRAARGGDEDEVSKMSTDELKKLEDAQETDDNLL